MRTRDSWLKDRYEFGRLRTESEPDDAPSPADAFKQRVVAWERMYHEWREEQERLTNHDELNRQIGERTAALRDASLHLCWGLSQLVSAKAEPQELYASDGELSLLDDAALVRQRMKRSDGNALAIVRTRLTLPLFLLDVLDNLDDVREHTHWFTNTHAAVTAFRSRPRVSFEYLSAMHAIETPNWPDAQRIDCIARTAGTVLHQLVKALGNALGATDWSNLKGRIDALLRTLPSTDHLLAEERRPAIRPILVEWATGIVQERTGHLVRTDDDGRERLPWDALERAVVAPLSDVGERRGASALGPPGPFVALACLSFGKHEES